jgi:hypothetical protein
MPVTVPTLADLDRLAATVAGQGLELAGLAHQLTKLQAQVDRLTPPPPVPAERTLKGGWKLFQEFPRGGIAKRFDTDGTPLKCWMVGHAQRTEVLEYDLPQMGMGADLATWPELRPVKTIPGWWPAPYGGKCYSNGLAFFRGKLWAAPRWFYDQVGGHLTLYAQDGETIELPGLSRQAFAGFVKRQGQEPFVGCGGYESGQGTVSGPTLALLDGTPLIKYEWPALPGANLENWNKRAPRPANYFPVNHQDDWFAWEPRNGEGRWACDRVWAGGIVLPEGVTYWPFLGTGEISYAHQGETLSKDGAGKTYVYRYDPTTYAFKGFEESTLGKIVGHEIDSQGRVYLAEWGAWKGGYYQTDVAVKVFE